jgi:hypothetical protein
VIATIAVERGEIELRRQVREIVSEWAAMARGTRVERMSVMRSHYASSATLLNVHVKLSGGEGLRVVFKLGGPNAQIPAARGVKPEFLCDTEREAWMYESVLPHDGLADAPRLLASGYDGGGARWLLMEWVGNKNLSQVGSRAVWCDAAARLARIHVWGEAHIDLLLRGSLVRWDDQRLHRLWGRRARHAQEAFARATGTTDPLAPLWRRYHVVADRLAAMPKTLVHGDFNASNILVKQSREMDRIRIVDWETAGVGPALLDLASLTSGRLPDRHRSGMIEAYRASLSGSRVGFLSSSDFNEALSWCRLALAVQWLGWSPGWAPPRAHAYDWRGEALKLARQLGMLSRT